MNAETFALNGDIVDDFSEFFAPVSADMIDGLVGQYNAMRSRIQGLADAVGSEAYAGALHHFIEGNLREQRHSLPSTIGELFDVVGATAHLRASYWDRALKITDVLDCMPQKRRDEWFEQIQNPLGKKKDRYSTTYEVPPLPEFDEDTVRATIGSLMASRSRFFAERVDGIFQRLSREHVTNRPEGFYKRMILTRVLTSFGATEHSTTGYINDLRCVIAKFMGRDEPGWGASTGLIDAARRQTGQWVTADAGALKIRVYKNGNGHLEVHPDMAWRLNAVLASLYPAAIPAMHRTRPPKAKKHKQFEMMGRPLPFAVINIIAGLRDIKHAPPHQQVFSFPYEADKNRAAFAEACRVLESIGGVVERSRVSFDYAVRGVLDEIITTGCIPDQKAHQFYPTPEKLARIAVDLAEIEDQHYCLEPSAGLGGLAKLMPKERTYCVEISSMHAKALEAQGFQVAHADFITWSDTATRFDRVVMNPPFREWRWKLHVEHAAKLVARGGRLVAILPASAKGTELPGFKTEWHGPYSGEFPGTSVSVVIMVADREGGDS